MSTIEFLIPRRFDPTAAVDGVWHTVRDELGQHYGEFLVTLMDEHSLDYKLRVQRIAKKREGQEMPVIPHGQVPTADQQKVIDRASIEVLVDLSITDWRNLPTKSGKTPPFTRELAVEYLTQAIFAADDLAHFARNIRNFQPTSVEEIEKN